MFWQDLALKTAEEIYVENITKEAMKIQEKMREIREELDTVFSEQLSHMTKVYIDFCKDYTRNEVDVQELHRRLRIQSQNLRKIF